MVRIAGAFLLAAALTGSGIALSRRQLDRLRASQSLLELILFLSGEIAFCRTPTGLLLQKAAAVPSFRKFNFLRDAAEEFTGKAPLDEIWKRHLTKDRGLFSPEAYLAAGKIGGILGSSDRDSQLALLSLLEKELAELIPKEREKQRTDGKLCRTLGLLAGASVILFSL